MSDSLDEMAAAARAATCGYCARGVALVGDRHTGLSAGTTDRCKVPPAVLALIDRLRIVEVAAENVLDAYDKADGPGDVEWRIADVMPALRKALEGDDER